MKKLPSQWIKDLAQSLEIKYKMKYGNIYFLDIWCAWWHGEMNEAKDFLKDFGAEDIEVKAFLWESGIVEYAPDLISQYQQEK